MNNLWELPGFNPGAIENSPDIRDYEWSELARGVAPFDWTNGYDVENKLSGVLGIPGFELPPNNQGANFSCGGQATAKYGSVLTSIFDKKYDEKSSKFVYAQTFAPGGGSMARNNMRVAIRQGWASEAILPSYQDNQPASEDFMERPQDITADIRQQAIKRNALAYVTAPIDIDTIAQIINACHGMVLGVRGSNNGMWGSLFPKPPAASDTIWAHYVYAGKAGLVNGEKKIKILNSWGSGIGERGWQWLGAEYFSPVFMFDPNLVIFNNNPIVRPDYDFTANLVYGMSGDAVYALQQILQWLGFFPEAIPPSGFYGKITAQSVQKFQIKYQVDTPANLIALAGMSFGPKSRSVANKL